MLKADNEEGDIHNTRREQNKESNTNFQPASIDVESEREREGPQSPTPYSTESAAKTSPIQSKQPRRRIQFTMASKLQIIPNNRQGQLNTAFLGTLPGILKIGEIMIAFVAFVLAICSDRRATTAAWTEHITFETAVVVAALLLGYVAFPHLTIRDEQTREGLIFLELLFYGINTLFYFIAIFLMVHLSLSWGTDGRGAAIMCAILCLALFLIFGVETVLKLRAWRGENASSAKIVQQGDPSTYPHPNAFQGHVTERELRREPGSEMA